MKVCPVCKSRCFDDMDTCYGCLHDFTKDNDNLISTANTQKIKLPEIENFHIPEYFELDTFPYIEEVNSPRVRGAHEKVPCSKSDNIVIKLEIPKEVLEKYITER